MMDYLYKIYSEIKQLDKLHFENQEQIVVPLFLECVQWFF
jgi:hypothetical protein